MRGGEREAHYRGTQGIGSWRYIIPIITQSLHYLHLRQNWRLKYIPQNPRTSSTGLRPPPKHATQTLSTDWIILLLSKSSIAHACGAMRGGADFVCMAKIVSKRSRVFFPILRGLWTKKVKLRWRRVSEFMGDSDDDHDRSHSRDKFRRERSDYGSEKGGNKRGDSYNRERNRSWRDGSWREDRRRPRDDDDDGGRRRYSSGYSRSRDWSPPHMKRPRKSDWYASILFSN